MGNYESKVEDNKRTAKTAMLNTIANVISLVVGMVIIPVLIRVLSPEDLGIASSFLSTRNTFVIIATCAVYAYVHKAMIEYKDNKEDYILSLVIFCFVAISIVFALLFPFKETVQRLFSLDEFLYYWLFASSLIFALYSIGYYYCVFHNKAKLVFFVTLGIGPVAQFLAVGFAVILPSKKYIGRVIGLDFVYMIVAIGVVIWMIIILKRTRPKLRYVKETLSFSVPIVPHLLSQMVLTQCDLIMITYFAGEDKTGVYSMGHTVGFLAFTVMSQIMAVWSPWVYRRLEEKDYKTIYDNSKLIILIGAYMSVGLMTVSTELVRIFLTEDYLPCIYIVPPLVVAMYFQFVYLFLYDVEYYYKKAKWIAAASVIAAIMNLILNFVCIQKFGYIAACYTTVASYLILVLINYQFCKKLGVRKLYSLKYILGSVAFVGAYAAVMMITSDFIIFRYVVLIGITIVLVASQYRKGVALLKSFGAEKK